MDQPAFAMLIEDHALFPTVLLSAFRGADEELLREREAPGRWSPLEILAHLRDEETTDFRKRALAALEGREVELDVDPERWVAERRYNEMDPGAVYLDFARERADSCRWLQSLRTEDLHAAVPSGRYEGMRAGDFIAAWRVHDLLHLRQFAQALALVTARRFGEWKADYAGRLPVPSGEAP